jgi:hypothetical protein
MKFRYSYFNKKDIYIRFHYSSLEDSDEDSSSESSDWRWFLVFLRAKSESDDSLELDSLDSVDSSSS